MEYQCEIKNQAAQPALVLRTRTTVQDLPQLFGKAYGMIAQYLGEIGEAPAGAPYAGYHNLDMQDLDIEIGFPVNKPLTGRGEIQASQIPGGSLATCLYSGSYDGMKGAYEALTGFVKERGCEPTGASYEIYLNDPMNTPPQELKTIIIFPLK